MKFLLLPILLLSFLNGLSQVVTTQFGTVQGVTNGNTYEFLGIPFAKPPIGSLRWKAPENPDSWVNTLSTTNFSPVCPQKKYEQGDTSYTIEGDEDCLYLNVWTTNLTSPNKAVMVYIHGGGNQQGGASQTTAGTQLFHGKNLSERGDVVVVTIQYRLGALGYLVHSGLEEENQNNTAGNYAVMDQILALNWIKNNISKFGGDSTNITIFGESAGGVNVGNLLTSQMAEGLFHKACIQSAVPTINDYMDSKNKGESYVDSFITTGTNAQKIDHMRSLDSDSLLYLSSSPIQGGVVQMNWQPVIDGEVFVNDPFVAFETGNFSKVPLIVGSNSEEMSLSTPQIVYPAMVNALINSQIPPNLQPQAHTLYPNGANTSEAKESYIEILTDAQFTSTTRRVAQCVSQNQTEPVWRYYFTHKHTIPQLSTFGSYHGMELFYVFNNWENATLATGTLFKPADDSVQNVMLDYWISFANTGNPNNSSQIATWPEYNHTSDCYLEIKATPDDSQCGLKTSKSDFWDQVVGFNGCNSSLKINHNENSISLSAYPNPTNSMIQFKELDQAKDAKNIIINVFNLQGVNIYSSNSLKPIDLSKYKNGVFILSVNIDGLQTQQRILKI
jgi:para-nitrobenzyl esterase